MENKPKHIEKTIENISELVNHRSWLVRFSMYFLGIILLSLVYYVFTASMSIATRGRVTQTYWYCSWDMGRSNNQYDTVKCPHHLGYKPAIPLVDHVCGEKEIQLAREAECDL